MELSVIPNGFPDLGVTSDPPLLEVRDLQVCYRNGSSAGIPALRGLSFSLREGEVLGIVGETGSGKSTLAHALLGLLPEATVAGRISLGGKTLPVQDEAAVQEVRWRRVALVFQTAGTGFDPVYRVGEQVAEPLVIHRRYSHGDALSRAAELWKEVGLSPDSFDRFPHQLSGGEKRLAMLAMALACDPELLVLDEPTAGLDSFTRAGILELLRRLRTERRLAMIVITHSLGDLPGLADRTMILYAGKAAELGPTRAILDSPSHPYSWGLVNAYPTMKRAKDLWGIRGDTPDPAHLPPGCAFAPRCTQADSRCHLSMPELERQDGRWVACHLGGLQPLLEVRGLSKSFEDVPGHPFFAVGGVDLRLMEGEVVALVGQTGSGKSTLARLLVGMLEADSGEVRLLGKPLSVLRREDPLGACRRLQMVFQDPFDAMSPRLSVSELVREPLDIQGMGSTPEREEQVRSTLAEVSLPATPDFLSRKAHQLSGGQLQRVAIARALVLRPKLLIADEPVSMLDASEQARLLHLLKGIQNARGMGLLLISHDIALVRKVADRILVMDGGSIVEGGPAERIIASPCHPCTRRLLAAARGAEANRDFEM